MLRAYGYALCGSRAVRHQLEVRGQNITTLAAISTEGLLAIDITSSKVNAEIFLDFLRGSLIPELCPFDGYNPRSIIIYIILLYPDERRPTTVRSNDTLVDTPFQLISGFFHDNQGILCSEHAEQASSRGVLERGGGGATTGSGLKPIRLQV